MKNMDYAPVSPSNTRIISFAALQRKHGMISDRRISRVLAHGFQALPPLVFLVCAVVEGTELGYHRQLPLHSPTPVIRLFVQPFIQIPRKVTKINPIRLCLPHLWMFRGMHDGVLYFIYARMAPHMGLVSPAVYLVG